MKTYSFPSVPHIVSIPLSLTWVGIAFHNFPIHRTPSVIKAGKHGYVFTFMVESANVRGFFQFGTAHLNYRNLVMHPLTLVNFSLLSKGRF